MSDSLDFGAIYESIRDTVIKILAFPVKVWFYWLPWWARWIIIGLFMFFCLMVILLAIKYRDAWRQRYF